MYYDHGKEPILTTDFDYDAVDGEQDDSASPQDAGERSEGFLLRMALSVALNGKGHPSGLPARMGALAFLIEGIPGLSSQRAICARLKISRTALWKAIKRLKSELPVLGEQLKSQKILSKTTNSDSFRDGKVNKLRHRQ